MISSLELVGAVLGIGGALMIAVTSLLVRIGTNEGGANDALVVVLICNVVILAPVSLVLYYPTYGLTPTSVVAFAFAGVVGTMLGRVFYFVSIERIGSSRTDAIKASQPLHATVIALFVLGESLTVVHFVGILLIMFGIAVVSWEITASRKQDLSRKELLIGLLIPLGASFFYGIEPTLAKIGFAEGTPVIVGLTIKTVVAMIGFVSYLRYRGILPTLSISSDENIRWYVAAGVANTTFLGFYYGALELARVNIVVPMVQMSPFFVMLLSYFLLPKLERITLRLASGAVLVVAGAITVVSFV
ncbi:EamA family transporter [Natrinema soli]|uniref:EamA family transporter n=1 Tax=Natrinema soli TaxID=1930624 RepID=A0ABD5SRT1_9EURY|nr:EamA family transporter [Natrinema soli]